MDVNTLRAVITAISFGMFIGIVIWAYSAKSERRFEEAARLPFADDER